MDYKLYNSINEIKIIGKSQSQVKKELYDLWRECFGDTKAYTDFYFTWKVENNRIITIYRDKILSSMLHLNPYDIKVRGKNQRLNYIVGVATRPEDRRKGLMRRLLETALNQMYEEKMPFTYLMPAAEGLYLPYGFRIIYKQPSWKQMFMHKDFKIIRDKDTAKKGEVSIIRIKDTDEAKIQELTSFTEKYLEEHYEIYAKRTPYYYKRLINEMKSCQGAVLLAEKDGNPIGYLAYMKDGGFGVAECIYKEEEKDLFFNAAVNEIGNDIYANLSAFEDTPAIMARIVDFKAFIKNMSAKEEMTLTVKVKDEIIRANNGVYELTFSKEGCKVVKTSKDPEFAADISELTAFFFGRLKEKDIYRLTYPMGSKQVRAKIDKINFYTKIFINEIV